MGDDQTQSPEPDEKRSLKSKAIVAGVAFVVLVVLWVMGAFVLPASYSRRIGDIADGRLWFSGGLGVVIGFSCTLIPLLLLRAAWRIRRGTKRAITLVVLAVLIAAPNLLLVGIVTGDGRTAINAERSLGTDAPWFRSWSLFGAIGGLATFMALGWLLFSRNRLKKKSQELEAGSQPD